MHSFEWFIAWRYLFSRERGALVSLITLISVAGVALGVAALIVVVGVMDGADDQLFGRMADLYPHVRIVDALQPGSPVDPALLKKLRADPAVALAVPIYSRKTLLDQGIGGDGRPQLVQLIGVDAIGAGTLFELSDRLHGERLTIPDRQIVVGALLAAHLQLYPGLETRATSTNPFRGAAGAVFKTMRFVVFPGGTLKTGVSQFDDTTAIVNRKMFAELYRVSPDAADYIHVKLKNPYSADTFKSSLNLSARYRSTSWSEENGEFFGALRLEKIGLGLTLLLTVLVAAFNIIGTLILTVMEKTREIGLLRAVGASERIIANIFILDGVMIGIVGVIAGTALGVGLCTAIRAFNLDLPGAVYAFDSLPVSLRPSTIAAVAISAMLICTLGAIYPARQAARLDPIEALRHD